MLTPIPEKPQAPGTGIDARLKTLGIALPPTSPPWSMAACCTCRASFRSRAER